MDEDESRAVATLLAGARTGEGSPLSNKGSPKAGGCNKRWRITPKALELLECVYAQEACPSTATRDVLALQLGATPRQVQVWFQNKRQRRAGKAKREQEATDKDLDTPSVNPTISTSQLFGLSSAAAAVGSSGMDESIAAKLAALAPSPSQPPDLHNARCSPPSGTSPQPGVPRQNSNQSTERTTVNSLSDLASVAECVDSIEHLTGGLTRVNSLKDLASLTASGSLKDLVMLHRAGSIPKDLTSLSKVVSLADLASFAHTLGAQQQAQAQQVAM